MSHFPSVSQALLTTLQSQGAALVHRAVKNLSQTVKNKIAGVVTFGDTQNLQDRGQIPNFPRDRVKIFLQHWRSCLLGNTHILAPHLDYVRRVPEAVSFLTGKIRAAGA